MQLFHICSVALPFFLVSVLDSLSRPLEIPLKKDLLLLHSCSTHVVCCYSDRDRSCTGGRQTGGCFHRRQRELRRGKKRLYLELPVEGLLSKLEVCEEPSR